MSIKQDNPIHFIIGIGPGRSGTSKFYNICTKIEGINCSLVKETRFFSTQNINHDQQTYLNNFFDLKNSNIYFEISNNYIFDTLSLSKIGNFIKDKNATILFFERNEMDRLRSTIEFELRTGKQKSEIIQVIQKRIDQRDFDNEFLYKRATKLIGNHIQKISFDDIKDTYKLNHIMNDIFNLDVSERLFNEIYKSTDTNESIIPRIRFLGLLARKLAIVLRKLKFFKLLSLLKQNKLIKSILFKKVCPTSKNESSNSLSFC